MKKWCLLFVLCSPYAGAADDDVIHLESTFIGDKEQPSVSHIIPWQPPEGPDKLYRPISGLDSEVYKPVDRDVQMRNMEYYDQLGIEREEIR